uniref:Ig-like domain-containing protein n=1 Tax=Xiphophorus maculatus TaxID=8083 RepID=A0A3B5QYZ1_XIPMA
MLSFFCFTCFFTNIDTLVPVVTVELGQSVTLTCDFTMKYQSNTWLYWYKQSPGNILTLIVKITKTITPNYGPEISPSKFNATSNEHSSSLTIFTTVHEDEGMYHCAQMDRLNSVWSGTYISVKGKSYYSSFNIPVCFNKSLTNIVIIISQESLRGHQTTKCFHSQRSQIQQAQRLCSVRSSLTLRTQPVQENPECSGSEPDQKSLFLR